MFVSGGAAPSWKHGRKGVLWETTEAGAGILKEGEMRRTRYQKGYLFKKGGAWYVRYREYRRLESGEVKGTQKCHRLCDAVQVYRSKSAAQQLANEFLKPFNDGTFSPDNAMGLDQFIENVYLPEIKATKRPSTYSGYVKIWSRYLKSRCPAPLRTFKTMACEQLLRDVQTEYDLSQTTLAHIKHFLSGTFRYAIRTGKIVQNPVRDVCLPGGKAPNETYAYSLDEVSRMLRNL